jgi:hypothetical protein
MTHRNTPREGEHYLQVARGDRLGTSAERIIALFPAIRVTFTGIIFQRRSFMGYPAQDLLLPRPAIQSYPRKVGFWRSLDYGNIARMAGIVGLGYLALRTLKMLTYGKSR